ncbi:MAG: phosphoenolpyruvate carboxykinase (ATP) [Elusimicrobia bacterium]|nr:phosphoenolpyruvate carboxykinase (ATP) [Elusimicrobiota bacterium]
MKNSPAYEIAEKLKSSSGLGIAGTGAVYWNLSTPACVEESLFRGEGKLVAGGPLAVLTGKHTGRSAKDKFLVREPSSESKIWWGPNVATDEAKFNNLLSKMQAHLKGKDIFVRDAFAGADEHSRLRIRIINELAWQNLFAKNMFIEPTDAELKNHVPDFTVMALPSFKADPKTDGTNSDTFIIINFAKKMVLIGGTAYAGEIKKSIFTVMNYILPLKNILTMHCSANMGAKGDTALFFGLSGTGKTTLSADPSRQLIGDDEHGWNESGIFNFEGGCYAKVINLSPKAEPQIYACTRRFGTILENVVYNPVTRTLDLDDASITPNTRAGYPLTFIDNFVPEKKGGHPKNIVMLTCDASGTMPPIARLSPEQALYHFISGYTAKVSGTELGMGKEPQSTFSACFGAPFMVHHPSFYANLLKEKIVKHKSNCWLVNTGWTGGPYGVGKRISIGYTRALLNCALDGRLNNVEYAKDPVFGFEIPLSCEGVPKEILNPSNLWQDKAGYMAKYEELAGFFVKNFDRFKDGCSKEIISAGPILK